MFSVSNFLAKYKTLFRIISYNNKPINEYLFKIRNIFLYILYVLLKKSYFNRVITYYKLLSEIAMCIGNLKIPRLTYQYSDAIKFLHHACYSKYFFHIYNKFGYNGIFFSLPCDCVMEEEYSSYKSISNIFTCYKQCYFNHLL
jgi:hypothetical protein